MTKNRPQQPEHSPPAEKPAVPLEKLIDEKPHGRGVAAGDKLASEAAKAPSPEIEAPDHADPERDDSVTDLVDNERRQRS